MRFVDVLYKNEKAGRLTQSDDGTFTFVYENAWLSSNDKPKISITLPKRKEAYQSNYLFSCFYHMLPEGSNKQAVCYYNKIDTDDHFSILATTAQNDTIGAISVALPTTGA